MEIRELRPADRAEDLAAVLPVAQAVLAEQMPGFPALAAGTLRLWCLADHRAGVRVFAAFADAEAVVAEGMAIAEWEEEANLDLLTVSVWVSPQARRRGAGSALYAEVLAAGAELGRSRVIVISASALPADALMTARGGRRVEVAIRSVLDLAGVSRDRLASAAEPSQLNAGYTLARWTDHCPPELAESFCAAMAAMDDAPQGDLVYEHAAHDLELLRERERLSVLAGVQRNVLAAVTAAGEVAGFTMFVSAADGAQALDIWDTGVVRAHRGRGLGLRLKAAQTLWMLDGFPAARWVQTFNNDDNTHMLAINRALGYRAAEEWSWYEFDVQQTSGE
ncbi:GNAT superfamily N-acetyltransferase [Kitasatospora sp. MAA4]|uniref:GNAT family N-acetyltransferase n=1 Tax=Kitasatospora sp. MAA4 TaxID=3035093 RepID=UPI002473C23C|nr:GNAT family N-acetyltransferase [Kitasatospora sp. MAA4]MDH6133762.1 GNAT superfamily N-acetyltransferase [Kitasatospora sp. MAA4]